MKRLIILIVCFCSFNTGILNAQTIFEAIFKTKIYSFPYDRTKGSGTLHYYTDELAKKIPIAVSYLDLDATIPDWDVNGEEEVSLHARFNNQDGRYYFHVLSNYTDNSVSDYLVLMNTDGTVSDYLWSGLYFPTRGNVTTMDFKINSAGVITVYQINSYPTKGGIDPFDKSITSFYGQRTDKTYEVVAGKFVLKSTQKYSSCTYKLNEMNTKIKRIWDGYGFESPLN